MIDFPFLVLSFQLAKSTSNLNDLTHSGRPRNEEPHVKKTTKKKSEKVEYIVRVDLVSIVYIYIVCVISKYK